MSSLKFCTDTLKSFGANESETLELLTYNQNIFVPLKLTEIPAPHSEPYLETWSSYWQDAQKIGVFAALQPHLVQLKFPIRAGISTSPEYRAATRSGKSTTTMEQAVGLALLQPEKLQLFVHDTLAGQIPVLVAENRADFVSLIQAFTKRNEPEPIPDSMGSCIISGYNNWHRIHQYKQQWQECPSNQGSDWQEAFQQLTKQPALYQDRFIVLSQGEYSNVAADRLGLDSTEWLKLSTHIRLEHECTHYITRRWFGSMRNNILDEIIADYRGIGAAIGCYRADWFLYFMGLEAFPTYRDGGRLENYLGNPALSARAFQVLQKLVKAAAENLAKFESQSPPTERSKQTEIAILIALTTLRLEELASTTGVDRIAFAVNEIAVPLQTT